MPDGAECDGEIARIKDQCSYFGMRYDSFVDFIVHVAFFACLGIGVAEFWRGIFHNVKDFIGMLGENVGEVVLTLLTYLVIGAGIVIPIWLISRLLSSRK